MLFQQAASVIKELSLDLVYRFRQFPAFPKELHIVVTEALPNARCCFVDGRIDYPDCYKGKDVTLDFMKRDKREAFFFERLNRKAYGLYSVFDWNDVFLREEGVNLGLSIPESEYGAFFRRITEHCSIYNMLSEEWRKPLTIKIQLERFKSSIPRMEEHLITDISFSGGGSIEGPRTEWPQ